MPNIKRCGIYVIERDDSDEIYIGSSHNIDRRWKDHRRQLNQGTHHSPRLQHVWNKYGPDVLSWDVLEECDAERLIEREQVYLDTFKPAFNTNPTAQSRRGAKMSAEQLARHRVMLRALADKITHCPQGHAYDERNTHLNKKGKRLCLMCAKEWARERLKTETPEQYAARQATKKAYYERTRVVRIAQVKAYAASRKEQKREYDRRYRAKRTIAEQSEHG